MRTPSATRRRAVCAAAVLLSFAGAWLLGAGGGFSHVGALFFAKLAHPFGRPADPAALPFEARVMWTEAFLAPGGFALLYAYGPLLLAGLAGALLLYAGPDGDEARRERLWLGWALAAYGAGFLLVTRMGVFLAFYLALAAGGLLARTRGRARTAALLLLLAVFLQDAYKTVRYRTGRDALAAAVARVAPPPRLGGLPAFAPAWERTRRWIVRGTPPEAAFVAGFARSASILLETGRAVVLQPKFETPRIRRNVAAFHRLLYAPLAEGGEGAFADWMKERQAEYLLYEPDWILERGPGSTLWIAGHKRPDPGMLAYRFHFDPQRLERFVPVFQGSRFRVFRLREEDDDAPPPLLAARPEREILPQPFFLPATFGATLKRAPTAGGVREGLGRLLRGEAMLLEAVGMIRRRGAWEAAGPRIQAALRLHRGLPMARPLLARYLLRRGLVAPALQNAEFGVRYEPDVATAWTTLAMARLAAEDPAGAREALDAALRLDPENPEAAAMRKELPPPSP